MSKIDISIYINENFLESNLLKYCNKLVSENRIPRTIQEFMTIYIVDNIISYNFINDNYKYKVQNYYENNIIMLIYFFLDYEHDYSDIHIKVYTDSHNSHYWYNSINYGFIIDTFNKYSGYKDYFIEKFDFKKIINRKTRLKKLENILI
jgi:hypothetical protein